MNNRLVILGVLLGSVLVSGCAIGQPIRPANEIDATQPFSKLKVCPEEKIINKMPSIGTPSGESSYYILNGKRREISEFDADWVKANCQVKEQEVY